MGAAKVHRVRKVRRVHRARRVPREFPVYKVRKAKRGTRGHRDRKASQVILVPRGLRGRQASVKPTRACSSRPASGGRCLILAQL